MAVGAKVLNDYPSPTVDVNGYPPHADQLVLPHRPELRTSIWMGGTDSAIGRPLAVDDFEGAVVIDCAGDLRDRYRRRAALYLPRVILDVEASPHALPRLQALAVDLAGAITEAAPAGAPRRVYVLCQYGMNRSGLMSGLLLRALGEEPDAVIELIRRTRPGSLSNQTFVTLIRSWRPDAVGGSDAAR